MGGTGVGDVVVWGSGGYGGRGCSCLGLWGGTGVGDVCLFVCKSKFQSIITVFCPDTRLTACTLKTD